MLKFPPSQFHLVVFMLNLRLKLILAFTTTIDFFPLRGYRASKIAETKAVFGYTVRTALIEKRTPDVRKEQVVRRQRSLWFVGRLAPRPAEMLLLL